MYQICALQYESFIKRGCQHSIIKGLKMINRVQDIKDSESKNDFCYEIKYNRTNLLHIDYSTSLLLGLILILDTKLFGWENLSSK